MSRRVGRESDSKRHRSKFYREPSPKRSRRDGKLVAERKLSNLDSVVGDRAGHDQKHRRRLKDALPLEDPLPPDSKIDARIANKEHEKKTTEHSEGVKHSSNPTDMSRSRPYSQQHDELTSAGQAGRSFSRRSTSGGEWWKDARDHHGARVSNKPVSHDMQRRDEKSRDVGEERHAWRHDGFLEMEKKEMKSDIPPSARKRPAFREKKVPPETEGAVKVISEPVNLSRFDYVSSGTERREVRDGRNSRPFAGLERPFARERVGLNRERYGGGNGRYNGGDRFNGRHGPQFGGGGGRVEKWKHDMFEEGNRSPTPKNEEEQIAKVEALLAL